MTLLPEHTFFLEGPSKTEALGEMLGREMFPGSVLALIGNLGAGKTCLARGLALGLDIGLDIPVVSPTYVLVHEYEGRIPFFHLDVYRLEGDDFYESGLEEYFDRGGLVAIEWADKITEALPLVRMEIVISLSGPDGRSARVRALGREYEQILDRIKKKWK